MTDILCMLISSPEARKAIPEGTSRGHRGDQTVPNRERFSLLEFSCLFKRNHPLDIYEIFSMQK